MIFQESALRRLRGSGLAPENWTRNQKGSPLSLLPITIAGKSGQPLRKTALHNATEDLTDTCITDVSLVARWNVGDGDIARIQFGLQGRNHTLQLGDFFLAPVLIRKAPSMNALRLLENVLKRLRIMRCSIRYLA